jgi:hypothetical protein
MRNIRLILQSGGLLVAALWLFSSAGLADPAGQAARQRTDSRGPGAVELAGAVPTPLTLDAVTSAARGQAPAPDAKTPPPERVLLIPSKMHVAMDILVDGRALPTVSHQGKTYLPVPKLGAEYEIRVWNHGPRRIVAVLSVDGLSVINGQPAAEDQSGYIVAAHSHIVIKGWRRSMDTVAAFRFVDRDRSYAGLTGRPENIGVIGLIAIEERVWQPSTELERKVAAPGALWARGQVGSIGTEYGREVDSRVYYVPFVRSSNRQTITYYYDTVAALREAGVPVDGPLPNPFPADPQFAPPPPGYKGK